MEALVTLVRREARLAAEDELATVLQNIAPVAGSHKADEDRPEQNGSARLALRAIFSQQASRWDRVWKEQAELRAEGDQEVEARLSNRIVALEVQVAQVHASVSSLARLQLELGAEAKLRQEADIRLQGFLKDFREHVVGEIEDLWANHRKMTGSFESMRGLVTKVIALVELQGPPPRGCQAVGPDELEISFGDGAVPSAALGLGDAAATS